MELFDSRLSALAIPAPAFWERARDTLAHAGQACHQFTGRIYDLTKARDFWTETLHVGNDASDLVPVDTLSTFVFPRKRGGRSEQRIVIDSGTPFAKHVKVHMDPHGKPQYLAFRAPDVMATLPQELAAHPACRMIGHDTLVGYNHLAYEQNRGSGLLLITDIFTVNKEAWMATVFQTSAKKTLQTKRTASRAIIHTNTALTQRGHLTAVVVTPSKQDRLVRTVAQPATLEHAH